MRKITFKKRDKEGKVYMDDDELKVNWNGKEVGVKKIEGDTLHLRETLPYEGGAIRGFRLMKDKMKKIRELKGEPTRKRKEETLSVEKVEEGEDEKLKALILGLEQKETELRHQFNDTRNFMRSWMDLLIRNLKDLEKELVLLSRKFARLEMEIKDSSS